MTQVARAVLLVEDNPADARLMQELVRSASDSDGAPFELIACQALDAAIARITARELDCVLLDLSLPDTAGLEGVERLRECFPAMPIVITTGLDDEEVAVDALAAGAQDYLVKGKIDGDGLRRAVRYAIERKRSEEELLKLANHDALTGLLNRRRFQIELDRTIAAGAPEGMVAALMILDIDNFKFVNDALGHEAGDELIRGLARELARQTRSGDVLGRLGGDEFALLLAETDVIRASEMCNDLLEAIGEKRMVSNGTPVRVTASVGLTMLDRPGLTAQQLLMEADVAMYEAKDAGRNRIVAHTGAPLADGVYRSAYVWIDRIRRALDENLFEVVAQPIVSLKADPVPRFELLIRMVDEDGSLLPPGAFLPVAERFGLIKEIDVWMVRRAVALIQEQQWSGRQISLEVNLSGQSIGDSMLSEVIDDELTRSKIEPSALVFEITETTAIANMEGAGELADRLRRWGCQFALDDFGAGFGSFFYLKHLPVDYLKIDGEFIRGLVGSEIDQQIVRAMIEIARTLDLMTIAEFVEDETTFKLLEDLGVDYAQGYHLGRPAPVAEQLEPPVVRAR